MPSGRISCQRGVNLADIFKNGYINPQRVTLLFYCTVALRLESSFQQSFWVDLFVTERGCRSILTINKYVLRAWQFINCDVDKKKYFNKRYINKLKTMIGNKSDGVTSQP